MMHLISEWFRHNTFAYFMICNILILVFNTVITKWGGLSQGLGWMLWSCFQIVFAMGVIGGVL